MKYYSVCTYISSYALNFDIKILSKIGTYNIIWILSTVRVIHLMLKTCLKLELLSNLNFI